jgi:hypothetical protein
MGAHTQALPFKRPTPQVTWALFFVTFIISIMLNILIANSVIQIYGVKPYEFTPLQWPRYVSFTAVAVIAANFYYWYLARFNERPVRNFLLVSIIILVASLIPPFIMITNPYIAGATTETAVTLMLMHIVPAAACMVAFAGWGHS